MITGYLRKSSNIKSTGGNWINGDHAEKKNSKNGLSLIFSRVLRVDFSVIKKKRNHTVKICSENNRRFGR